MRVVPFARPFFTEEAIQDILLETENVLRSGWLTSGPKIKQFEEQFREKIGVEFAVAMNSCTAALHSILLALDVGPGDEVIVPANTFVATGNAAIYVGAKPIIADVDPNTFNISTESVAQKLSNKTRVIIPVHVGGNPCDMKELQEMASDHGIHIVEDCAHALGSKIENSACGMSSVASAFSFYPTKLLTTGEGGMVVTDSDKIANKVRLIRNQGRRGLGPLEITDLGYNFRMPEMGAVLGVRLLRELDSYVVHRNQLASKYKRELSSLDWIRCQAIRSGNLSSYYSYIVLLDPNAPVSRDQLRETLASFGIETSIIYHPIHLQPLYRRLFETKEGDAPVSEILGRRSLALPMWNGLTEAEIEYVAGSIRTVSARQIDTVVS